VRPQKYSAISEALGSVIFRWVWGVFVIKFLVGRVLRDIVEIQFVF
jgi:hypothetical protein